MPSVYTTEEFDREYRQLPKELKRRVAKTMKFLRENPYHPSLRTHKRKGESGAWQARVTQDYRIYFWMEGDDITLFHITAHE